MVKPAYHTHSPILFIVFNRPHTTSLVFNAIRDAKPSKLYIAADGPRKDNITDNELCLQTRNIIKQIDWDCELHTLYSPVNKGCKNAVADAISWFFKHEEEGIILEDDCLPDNSFYRFCDELLNRYRNNNNVSIISGSNHQNGKIQGNATYYFSNLTHVWGWASWRRVWNDYDRNLTNYTLNDVKFTLSKIFNTKLILQAWQFIFEELKGGRINTWDYQLAFINFFKKRLSIIPNQNLIKNIGFDSDATHTVSPNAPYNNLPTVPLPEIIHHPTEIKACTDADVNTLNSDFMPMSSQLKKHYSLRRRFKRSLKKLFKSI